MSLPNCAQIEYIFSMYNRRHSILYRPEREKLPSKERERERERAQMLAKMYSKQYKHYAIHFSQSSFK